MFTINNDIPTSMSLLMQCGYRSKVCTNPRATKINGTLHKLCQFHRRKANRNQQRLHKRKREERVARTQSEEAMGGRPAKKAFSDAHSPMDPITMDPIPYAVADKHYPRGFFAGELAYSSFTPADMCILELLVQPLQPLPVEPSIKFPPNSPSSVDDTRSIIV